MLHSVLPVNQWSTPFYATLCVTCRSVVYTILCYTLCYLQISCLHHSILHSVLPVDQCIYTILFFTLCYLQIRLYTPLYAPFCITCRSLYIHILFFTLCYLQISVSTAFYSSLCVTCRSVYPCHFMLHSVLQVDQCIYTILCLTLCYM